MPETVNKTHIFNKARPRLFGIAYRMLGTRDDAEDIVQEAYIRWHKADTEEIEKPEAWLVTVTTRLSIDRLRKASAERETYIGPWLPEPLAIDSARTPEEQAELASDLSLAFMVMLERLSPVERAVFLLHDVFDCDYPEIARIVGKNEPALRQIISRARSRVRNERHRFVADDASRVQLIKKFAAASYAGDEATVLSLFSDDIAMASDGGGKITPARKIVRGKERLARLFTLTVSKNREHITARLVRINGEIGTVEYFNGQPFAATTFTMEGGKITAIYRVMNPEKLRAFADPDENSFGDLSQPLLPPRLG